MKPRLACLTIGFICSLAAIFPAKSATPRTSFKFDFGSGPVAAGFTQVSADAAYSKDRGFGFEPGAKIIATERSGQNPLPRGLCTSDQPFFFSVAVPEGNYRVRAMLNDQLESNLIEVRIKNRR